MFSFFSDMNHSNMYVVGLALCTFANISSEVRNSLSFFKNGDIRACVIAVDF